MRLSTIKLAGFKSFVEPTKIPFPDQMTCVVGPNGCGKSNVIDAVRWVLGESSAKNLRGDAMTDVIFNGSTNRKAISQASVELIFDNTQGDLPNTFAHRNQIAIKRLVTRDGQSLYFLNGSKCRKRDITDIFLGTGLGPRSYAIIEQGMISRLIESKPQELRVFLEEAAGVSKYKERRRETQTRIKSSRENLERLLDVRKELQAQLDKLAVQSVDAKKYRELKAQERTLKGQVAVLKWQKLHQQQLEKSKQIKELNEKIAFFKTAHLGHDDVLASLESQVTTEQDALNDAQHQQHIIHTELTRAEQQHINIKQQIQSLKQNVVKLEQRKRQSEELKTQQQNVCEQLAVSHQEISEYSVECNEQVEELTLTLADLMDEKNKHTAVWQTLNQQQHELNNQVQLQKSNTQQTEQSLAHINTQLSQLNSQIDDIKNSDLEQQLAEQQKYKQTLTQELASKQTAQTHCNAALKEQTDLVNNAEQQRQQSMQHINELNARIAGLKSSLGIEDDEKQHTLFNQLQVKSGFEHIVEQALQTLEHLNVADVQSNNSVWPHKREIPENSVAALITEGVYPDILTRIAFSENADLSVLNDTFYIAVIDKAGALHARNWHRSADKNAENSQLLKHTQLKQKTASLVDAENRLASDLEHLNTLKAQQKELSDELALHKNAIHQLAQNIAVATTRSDMLKEQVAQFLQQLEKYQQQKHLLATEQSHLLKTRDEHVLALDALHQEQSKLAKELESAEADNTRSNAAYNEAATTLEQYKTLAHQATLKEQKAHSDWQLSQTKLNHAEQELNSTHEEAQELQVQIEALLVPEQELNEQIAQLLLQHQQGEASTVAIQKKLSQAKQEFATKQSSLKHSQGELVGLQEQHQKLSIEEQSLIIKAQAALEPLEELKQSLKSVLETLPDSLSLNAAQNQISGLMHQLDKLGPVNLAAIDEFEQAKARNDYLNNQLEDLTKALNTLEGAIRKIDSETKTRFKATFDQVNNDFAELFPKVFGGGSAYLELTSDDLLESGVSIMAQPPGKKNSTIHLLSGGEKALSALSLVFSIFRLNPAPFCMLDEVDAPLDDANVVRFCRLVEEMSQSVQFIYISHNKIAMEMAGRLTGVTMVEPGVSRMVAVDIEQAVQLAHT